MSIEVKVRRNESIDKALRRLKRLMDAEGTLKEFKDKRYFEKPSEKKRQKKAQARIRARKEAKERDRGSM